jgi:hypothetical protein
LGAALENLKRLSYFIELLLILTLTSSPGYYGGYGSLPSKEITIAFYCTQSETSGQDNFAFQLFKKLAARIAPDELINY